MKAKVLRGVRIRDEKTGVCESYAEGAIVDIPMHLFHELKTTNYVVAAPAEQVAAAPAVAATIEVSAESVEKVVAEEAQIRGDKKKEKAA